MKRMTVDELYEYLCSPLFLDEKSGNIFYNYYIYQYPASQEYEMRRQIQEFKQKLERPTNFVNALVLDLFRVFCEYLQNEKFGDTSLLEVLPFRIVSGGGPDALRDISSGLISRSAAQRLFGSLDVVGKQMVVSNTYPVTITGIIEDVPQNSFYTPEVILPMKLLATMNGAPEDKADRWSSWSM